MHIDNDSCWIAQHTKVNSIEVPSHVWYCTKCLIIRSIPSSSIIKTYVLALQQICENVNIVTPCEECVKIMTICYCIPAINSKSGNWESWISKAGKLSSSGIYLNKFTLHLPLPPAWESETRT